MSPAHRELAIPEEPALMLPGPCRLGLLADTHGWLDPGLERAFEGVQAILHAGDLGRPEVLDALRDLAPTLAVRGNIDGGALLDLPLVAWLEAGGRRIALLHIAGNPLRPNRDARTVMARLRPDVLLVGHSHVALAGQAHGLTWINPGAAGRQGFHDERTAFLLDLDAEGRMELRRIALGPRSRRRAAAGEVDRGPS